MTPLVFLGATSFREHAQIVRDINEQRPTYSIQAILDDNSQLHGATFEGIPVVGPLSAHAEFRDSQFVFGIGSSRARFLRFGILKRLGIPRQRYATLIDPSATIYPSAKIGRGCIIFPGAVVCADAVVEDFVQVLFHSAIGVANRVCEGALITSHVVTTGDVVLGPYSHIGASSAIAPGVLVGAGAQVAIGSVVLRDVPVGAFVLGNPARVLRRDEIDPPIVEIWERLLREHIVARQQHRKEQE